MNEQHSEWVEAGAAAHDPRYHAPDPLHGRPARRTRDVWINLDVVFPRDPTISARRAISGLDMTGVVPGLLTDWIQAGTGKWYGCCSFRLNYVDGRNAIYEMRGHLVAEDALRPRSDSS